MERLGVFQCDEHPFLYALSPQNLSHIPQRDLDLPFLSSRNFTTVTDCRGFLCFDFADRTVICNPTTQQLKFLPPTPRLDDSHARTFGPIGFGYDSTSDDYKVIRDYLLLSDTFTTRFELYSLRHNSWREIPAPFDRVRIRPGSLYINGSAYWVSSRSADDDAQFVLAFDFATETFSWFSMPPHDPPDTMFSLFKIDDDSLGAVLYSKAGFGKFFELWTWRRGWWTRLYDRVFIDNVEGPLGLIHGRLLFLGRAIGRDNMLQLVVYDWGANELKELDIYESRFRMMIISYVESRAALPNAMPFGYYDNEAGWEEYWHGYQAHVNQVASLGDGMRI